MDDAAVAALNKRTLAKDLEETEILQRFSRARKTDEEVTYEFTADPALLHQYYLLRKMMYSRVYGVKGMKAQEDYYDRHSLIATARVGKMCIGGGRLTVRNANNGVNLLPFESLDFKIDELLPVLDFEHIRYGEFSRFIVSNDYLDGDTSRKLSYCLIEQAIRLGLSYVFTTAPIFNARLYKRIAASFGLKSTINEHVMVPDKPDYEGVKQHFVMLDLTDSAAVKKMQDMRSELFLGSSIDQKSSLAFAI